VPVTLVGVGAGLSYSTLGGTHHSQEDVAIMSALPNMMVVAPCDPLETSAAVWACAEAKGPTYLRLGKAGEPTVTAEAPDAFQVGRIRLIRPGKDVCFISYGPIMKLAFEAAEHLESEGVGPAAIISAHTLKPLDREGIAALMRRFDRIVVVEEHSVRGGLAAQVKQLAYEAGTRAQVLGFSLQDEFIHTFGSPQDLWRAHGISADAIASAVKQS
jgi:transketolase